MSLQTEIFGVLANMEGIRERIYRRALSIGEDVSKDELDRLELDWLEAQLAHKREIQKAREKELKDAKDRERH